MYRTYRLRWVAITWRCWDCARSTTRYTILSTVLSHNSALSSFIPSIVCINLHVNDGWATGVILYTLHDSGVLAMQETEHNRVCCGVQDTGGKQGILWTYKIQVIAFGCCVSGGPKEQKNPGCQSHDDGIKNLFCSCRLILLRNWFRVRISFPAKVYTEVIKTFIVSFIALHIISRSMNLLCGSQIWRSLSASLYGTLGAMPSMGSSGKAPYRGVMGAWTTWSWLTRFQHVRTVFVS